jgi:mercuric ion binding protein
MKTMATAILTLLVTTAGGAATRTATFDVQGWTCGSCAAATRIALKKLEGVEEVKTDVQRTEAVVTYDDARVSPEKMVPMIERLGYKATLKAAAAPIKSPTTADKSAKLLDAPLERVSFFEVPLECGAVDGLGCGSASKPVLKAVERDPRVKEAKVNYSGTILAVVWNDPEQASSGRPAVESAFKERDLDATILRGQARDTALKEYGSGRWYGAAEVDRLSEREAHVIATRLINRAHLDLAAEKLMAFNRDLSAGIATILTRDKGEECARHPFADLTQIASKHLNEQQMAQLQKAADRGLRALPGEEQ